MKYLFYPAFLTALGMLTACSDAAVDTVDENIPNDQKTEITFTLSAQGANAQTRADGDGPTTHGFSAATEIVARYESYKASAVGAQPDESAVKRTSRTVLKANPEASGAGYSEVVYLTDDYKRYWDDAYSRLGYLSIYAIAVPGKPNTHTNNGKQLLELVHEGSEAVSTSNVNWKKNDDIDGANDVKWTVSTTQSEETLTNEDLCYSNNIRVGGENGRYVWDFATSKYSPENTGAATHQNGQMRIALQNSTDKTSTGHFDHGHLVFNHALTRLTVNMRRGAGFADTDPFKFATNENVKIKGVPTASTLNIKTGQWSATATVSNGIDKMRQSTSAAAGYMYSLRSQFIPGFKIRKDNNTPVLEYTIDDNVYRVTEAAIYNALKDKKNADGSSVVKDNAVEMLQGKNYVINIAVNKNAISSVTATLVDWEYITAEEIAPENHYITISDMMSGTSSHCANFDLYRVDDPVANPYTGPEAAPANKNWFKHYKGPAMLEASGTDNVWKTNWYWESNKSFYHLRTVNKGTAIVAGADATNPKDYFAVTSGPLEDDNSKDGFNDYHWGAPMKSDVSMKYDTSKGYEEFIYPAIGSTTNTLNIIEHHMMSNIHIVLHTPTKDGDVTKIADNGVQLCKESATTKVELNRFYANGKVEIARGLVTPTDVVNTVQITAPSPYFMKDTGDDTKDNVGQTQKYSYRVVPQSLIRDADKVGLTITTPDGNVYYVPDLSAIKAATVSTNNQHHREGEDIKHWYPGYDYTYDITLKKTGIASITCTLAEWKVVTANIGDITLEN